MVDNEAREDIYLKRNDPKVGCDIDNEDRTEIDNIEGRTSTCWTWRLRC